MRPILLAALFIICCSYSVGVAQFGNFGSTGAPDGRGSMENTCGTCHNTGNFGEITVTALFDGLPIRVYEPGRTYAVTVTIQAQRGTPSGYGYQAQLIRQDPATDLYVRAGTVSAPGDTTRVVTTTDLDRSYVEHTRINPDNKFSFDWTAPEAKSGTVQLYAVANAVNGNGQNSGDNGSVNPLVISLEEQAGAVSNQNIPVPGSSIYPNPISTGAPLTLTAPSGYTLQTTEIWSSQGRLVYRGEARGRTVTLDELPIPAGYYLVRSDYGSAIAGWSTLVVH